MQHYVHVRYSALGTVFGVDVIYYRV